MDNFKTAPNIEVNSHADSICCDGGGGALGHPKVWYNFDNEDSAQCSYCDRIFVKKA